MKRRRRAYQQGDLDGLCGVYSVVNALRYLLHLNDKQCQELFGTLIKALGETSRRPHNLLTQGIVFTQLKRLVATAAECRWDQRDCSFHARVLRLRPEERTLPCLWAALEQEVGPACVAIIGITGKTDHWCVVYQVTPKTLRVLDSDGWSRIDRSRCTVQPSHVRYSLELSEVLLIKR